MFLLAIGEGGRDIFSTWSWSFFVKFIRGYDANEGIIEEKCGFFMGGEATKVV